MLRKSLWTAALSEAELGTVMREAHERQVPIGGRAMRCGDRAGHWIGVIDGLIKMSVSQADGRHTTFAGATSGGWDGEGSMLKPGPWRCDGVAARESCLARVPRHTFERRVTTNLAFYVFLLSHLNARLSLFIGLVEYDRLLGSSTRVARCLASLFDPDHYPRVGGFLQLRQKEVGLLFGASQQRTNEALHELERTGGGCASTSAARQCSIWRGCATTAARPRKPRTYRKTLRCVCEQR